MESESAILDVSNSVFGSKIRTLATISEDLKFPNKNVGNVFPK